MDHLKSTIADFWIIFANYQNMFKGTSVVLRWTGLGNRACSKSEPPIRVFSSDLRVLGQAYQHTKTVQNRWDRFLIFADLVCNRRYIMARFAYFFGNLE